MGLKRLLKQILFLVLSIFPEPGAEEHRGPGKLHLHWRRGWVKAQLLRPWWRFQHLLGGPRVVCGRRLAIQGKLRLKGQGTIVLGDDIIVGSVTDLFTQPRSVIRVGDRTFLNGTRMSCVELIDIGADVILADARLLDTDFHSLSRRRHDRESPVRQGPIYIEDNVWIAMGALVLKGVRIGRDSVVAAGAVVNKDVPPGRIYGGNPAKDLGPVPD